MDTKWQILAGALMCTAGALVAWAAGAGHGSNAAAGLFVAAIFCLAGLGVVLGAVGGIFSVVLALIGTLAALAVVCVVGALVATPAGVNIIAAVSLAASITLAAVLAVLGGALLGDGILGRN